MDIEIVNEPEQKVTEDQAIALKNKVDALQVVDQSSYDLANALNAEAYAKKKAFHDWFDPIDEASKKQRQATIAQGKKIDQPLDYVIKTTGSRAAAWIRQEQARVAEEKRKLEEEARKKAEEEALKAAETLEKEGMSEMAERILEQPVVTPKVEAPAIQKSEGTFVRDNWSAEVVDLMALVKAVAEGKAPLYYLQAAQTALNTWARTSKGTESLPGVKVLNTPSQGRRGAF